MFFKLAREDIEHFSVEVARRAVVLKDLDDAACLPNASIIDYFFFKIG